MSSYTEAPQYPKEFRSMMVLREEIESSTKQELKKWILSIDDSFDITNILTNGLYQISNMDNNNKQIDKLLLSLQKIKKTRNDKNDKNDSKKKKKIMIKMMILISESHRLQHLR